MFTPTETAKDHRHETLLEPYKDHYTEAYSYVSYNGSVPRRFIILIRKGHDPVRRIMSYARYVYSAHLYKKDGSSIPIGMEVDHKNDNSLDDRFENLQLLTRRQNLDKRANKSFRKIAITRL